MGGAIQMMIRWHGHSCFELGGKSATVVLDPHDGKSIGIPVPSVRGDLVLITHNHFDHNVSRVVAGNPEVLKSFVGRTKKKGISIQGIKEYHDNEMGAKRGEISIYRIEMDGISFVHMGDIGHIPGEDVIKKLKNTDFLFIPVGGVFTVGPEEAWDIAKKIGPKVVVPMHYRIGGLSLSIKPLNGFLENLSPEKVLRVGNSVDFDEEDLPDETEIWVFSL